jgi:hypothetical protein
MSTFDRKDWSDRRYDLSFEAIAPKIAVRPYAPAQTLGELAEKGTMAVLSSIVGHQILYFLEGRGNTAKKPSPTLTRPVSALAHNLSKTLRAT